jgi:hypothetical protein
MDYQNQYGLSRSIPNAVKQEIRSRSKFGCVLCRFAICQYEHIDPEFKDAKVHDPEKMCLLCGCCHDRVHRKRLSKNQIFERYQEIQAQTDVKPPFEDFAFTGKNIKVKIGAMIFEQAETLIQINGEPLLLIHKPEPDAGLPLISGTFYDSLGSMIFSIENNVWNGPIDVWDMCIEANRLEIRTAPRCIALAVDIFPPGDIHIRRLNLFYQGCHIYANENEVCLGYSDRDGNYRYIGLGKFTSVGSKIGIDIDLSKVKPNPSMDITIVGGKGIAVKDAGLRVGVGSGRMLINSFKVWDSGIHKPKYKPIHAK